MHLKAFAFNPFSENTYVLSDGPTDCLVIDPGMSNEAEWAQFDSYLKSIERTPTRVLLTHGHIDHVLGCREMHRRYGLVPECHPDSVSVLSMCQRVSEMYGVPYEPSPDPKADLSVKDTIDLGDGSMEIRYVPGHAPGHIVFIHHGQKVVIAGDTLFQGSIGRTDLPGGDHDLLLEKIVSELYSLPEDYVVHSGHGGPTTIGKEKESNPFVRG